MIRHESLECSGYRHQLADGTGGFLVCERDQDPCVVWVSRSGIVGEAALLALREDVLFHQPGRSPHDDPTGTDLVLVQRLGDGAITILHWDGITTCVDGQWSYRNYQYRYRVEEVLAERIGGLADDARQTIRSLLRICLHVLSPIGCGATIIMSLDDDVDLPKRLNCKNAMPSLNGLTVHNRSYHRVLAHLLSQFDGAAIIGEDGRLRQVKTWLKHKGRRDAASPGGMRQLSAQNASIAIKSPIFTVSADGPVRVYHAGEVLADFSQPPQ